VLEVGQERLYAHSRSRVWTKRSTLPVQPWRVGSGEVISQVTLILPGTPGVQPRLGSVEASSVLRYWPPAVAEAPPDA
jgi:hypothetical protein